MTISDAYVLACCDAAGCRSEEEIDLSFVYPDLSGKGGRYDHSDKSVEKKLARKDWLIHDGKHFCCQECADAGPAP